MQDQHQADWHMARSHIYGLFGNLLSQQPSAPILDQMMRPEVVEHLAVLCTDPSIGRRFRQVAEQYSRGQVTAEQILLDYEGLMRVPGPAYAHPYESFYRRRTDGGKGALRGALCGRPTLEAERFYRSEGLVPKYGRVDFADHIGAELTFMAHLCRRHAKALAEGDRQAARRLGEKQRRFASDHLFGWTEDFCKALEAGAATQFFKGLARMLLDFLAMEKKTGQTPPMNG
jgi:putative dimethyl sulfoxide reductase chaperone